MADREEPMREPLGRLLVLMARHPARELFALWSWKTAAISAFVRAAIFFFANRHGGGHHPLRAGATEAVFAIFASGLLGAVTQRLRFARPVWATALVVWLGMPLLMLAAQIAVHSAAGTKHLRAGVVSSFVFAAVASGFTWYAMAQGTLLAGREATSAASDAKAMPRVVLGFLLAGPQALVRRLRS
jgi:hypothetical protein